MPSEPHTPSAAYSPRWAGHGDLLRTQLQGTGRIRLSFITLADLWTVVDDLGIDPDRVEFRNGYALVEAEEETRMDYDEARFDAGLLE